MAELIAALDFPETDQILSMAGTLRGIVPWCKVGMEAFVLAGPDIIAKLSGMGFRVFLDLKFYDIPNTVAQAVRAGVKTGASLTARAGRRCARLPWTQPSRLRQGERGRTSSV